MSDQRQNFFGDDNVSEIGETINTIIRKISRDRNIAEDDIPVIYLYKYLVQVLIFASNDYLSQLRRDDDPDQFENLLLF